jgi:hypothetical protein
MCIEKKICLQIRNVIRFSTLLKNKVLQLLNLGKMVIKAFPEPSRPYWLPKIEINPFKPTEKQGCSFDTPKPAEFCAGL